MRVLKTPTSSWPEPDSPSSMTIGVLDGVHRGHRELLGRLDDTRSRTVLTFDPHPIEILRPGADPRLITDIDERLNLLESIGIDQVVVVDLAEMKDLSPEEFVKAVLVDRLALAHIVVGIDFRFGKNRGGDGVLLRDLGRECGFEVESVDLVTEGVATISSSRIRREIETGNLESVAELMPTRFQLTNTVVEGDQRGRALGFPTANMSPVARKVVPATGVYAGFAHLKGEVHRSAVNVGVRPTFGSGDLVIEAHLLDFDEDIYGESLTVEFVSYLRPELRFESVDDLVVEMTKDARRSASILAATQPTVS